MKKMLAMIFAGLVLAGCGTTTTTKVTEYDSAGNVVKVTETVSDNSDFANYFATGDGNATDLRGDISKFNLGWNGYGLNWLSISGGRTKAPVKTDACSSAEALEQMAKVISANKTEVKLGDLNVNPEAKTSEQ